jgi:hypothetical protein
MKNFLLTLWYFPLRLWYNYKSWRWERKCIEYFGAKPEKIYVSKEAYDELVRRINNPDPEQIESLNRILQRKSPWDEE